MKSSYSIAFFILIFIAIFLIFSFIWKDKPAEQKILLQTLKCQSDKLDSSIYNLRGDTTLIGAYINFKSFPLDDALRQKLDNWGVTLRENTQIFDIDGFIQAEIPTDSLCSLVAEEAITRIFIPELN